MAIVQRPIRTPSSTPRSSLRIVPTPVPPRPGLVGLRSLAAADDALHALQFDVSELHPAGFLADLCRDEQEALDNLAVANSGGDGFSLSDPTHCYSSVM